MVNYKWYMVNYKWHLIFVFVSFFVNVNILAAKTTSEMFVSMPDSLLPYVSSQQRNQLLALKTTNPDSTATLPCVLGDVTVSVLNDDRITVLLSKNENNSRSSASIEIGRINENSFVFIKTYGAPERESVAFVCDSLWQNRIPQDFSSLNFFADTIPANKLSELKKMVEFPLIEAHLTDTPGEITISLNAPLLNAEDKAYLRRHLKTLTHHP